MLTVTKKLLAGLWQEIYGEELPTGFLFGVRGATPYPAGSLNLVENAPAAQDLWDDAVGYFAGGQGGAYPGTVDPGRYFTQKPMNEAGCAHVIDGRYRFTRGRHNQETRAWRGRDVSVWRDRDRDGVQDAGEAKVYVVGQSINLHGGGKSLTVGSASAGCQVVVAGWWGTFRDLTYRHLPEACWYWLLDYAVLAEWKRKQALPRLVLNGLSLPATLPMWTGTQGNLKDVRVTLARELLSYLALDGQQIAVTYQPKPVPSLVFAGGERVTGRLVRGRLVVSVTQLLRALDPGVTITWDLDDGEIQAQSSRLSLFSPLKVPLATLPEATDGTVLGA